MKAEKNIAKKAHAVVFIELLKKAIVNAYEAELYWEAVKTLQLVQTTYAENGLSYLDVSLSMLTAIASDLDACVSEAMGLGKRFDCLTATSCPSCWK